MLGPKKGHLMCSREEAAGILSQLLSFAFLLCSREEGRSLLKWAGTRLSMPLAAWFLLDCAVIERFSLVWRPHSFREELGKAGVIFCSISEAVRDHPDLVRKHLGSVVRISSLRRPPVFRFCTMPSTAGCERCAVAATAATA